MLARVQQDKNIPKAILKEALVFYCITSIEITEKPGRVLWMIYLQM